MLDVIGISGKAFSGKDTVASYICKQSNYIPRSFAAPIKKIAMDVFGFTESQCYDQELKHINDPFWDITPRKFLQIIGTDMFRDCFRDDVWLKLMEKELSLGKTVVIPDIRFQNELNWVLEHNGIVVHINRNIKSALSDEELQHISEKPLFDENVLQYYKDFRIPVQFSKNIWCVNNNRSLTELYKQIDMILEYYK